MAVEHQQDEMILAVLGIGVHPLTPGERRELTGDTLTGGLVADDAVLGVETFPDNLGVRGSSSLRPSSFPVDGIGLVDILTEAAAVEGEIKAAPEEGKHEGADEPRGKGSIVVGFSCPELLVFLMMIVIHG
jgi:hypothetical protein